MLKVLTDLQRQTWTEREKGDILTWRQREAAGGQFKVSLSCQLPLTLPFVSRTVCHTESGGDLSGGNKIRGTIIFPWLLHLFLAWQSIWETWPELCTLPVSPPANIYGKHANSVLTHRPYCVFLCVYSGRLYLCGADKYRKFQVTVCNPGSNTRTHIVAHSVSLTQKINSIE